VELKFNKRAEQFWILLMVCYVLFDLQAFFEKKHEKMQMLSKAQRHENSKA
jgi:hypothetical protein